MAIDDPNPLLSLWWKLPGMKSRPEPDSGEMSSGIIIPFQGPRQGILRVLIPRGFMGFWWWSHSLWVFMCFFLKIIWRKIRSTRKLSLGPKKTGFSHRKNNKWSNQEPSCSSLKAKASSYNFTTSSTGHCEADEAGSGRDQAPVMVAPIHPRMTWRRGVNKLWKVVELHHFPHDFPHGKLANLGSLFLEKAISKTKKTASDTRKSGF